MGKDKETEPEKVVELGSVEQTPTAAPIDTFEPMEVTSPTVDTPSPAASKEFVVSPEKSETIDEVEAENTISPEPTTETAAPSVPSDPMPSITTPTPTIADVTQPTDEKQRSKAWLGWLISIVLILALGATCGWFYSRYQYSQNSLSDTKSQLTKTQSELATAQATAAAAKEQNVISTTAVVQSDEDLIKDATIAYGTARKGSENAKLTVTIIKKELPFAQVSVAVEGDTGYGCVLKKSNGIWIALFCGQSSPPQETLDLWGVPSSIATASK